MAVTTSRLVGTGDSDGAALDSLMNKLPKSKYFSPLEKNTDEFKVRYASDKNSSYGGYIPCTKALTGNTHEAIINVAQSTNGIFFYTDKGTAVGCIVKMSDGTEFMMKSRWDGLSTEWHDTNPDNSFDLSAFNAESPTLNKIYIPSSSTGYVAMCPVVYQNTNIGKVGADSGDVYFVEGIANSVWSPNGVEINGHTYYGCGKYCTRAD